MDKKSQNCGDYLDDDYLEKYLFFTSSTEKVKMDNVVGQFMFSLMYSKFFNENHRFDAGSTLQNEFYVRRSLDGVTPECGH